MHSRISVLKIRARVNPRKSLALHFDESACVPHSLGIQMGVLGTALCSNSPIKVTAEWGSPRRHSALGLVRKNDGCLGVGVKYQSLNQVKAWATAAFCHWHGREGSQRHTQECFLMPFYFKEPGLKPGTLNRKQVRLPT